MSIIFLDIDGCLNSHKYHTNGPGWGIHNFHLETLYKILKKTHSDIIISSSWRYGGIGFGSDLQIALSMCGDVGEFCYSKIIGKTENLISYLDTASVSLREFEIQEWIFANNPDNFLIIDDIEMINIRNRQVLTTMEHGLLPEHFDIAVKILGGIT